VVKLLRWHIEGKHKTSALARFDGCAGKSTNLSSAEWEFPENRPGVEATDHTSQSCVPANAPRDEIIGVSVDLHGEGAIHGIEHLCAENSHHRAVK
jgi:hypothetical protein